MQVRGPWSLVMRPFSWVYRALAAMARRRALRNQVSLAVPVVVVGNVIVGGSGKTPIVAELVDHLRRGGWSPGIVSRGYGAPIDANSPALHVQAATTAAQCGDEPKWLAQTTDVPVFVHPDRVLAARACLALYPQVDVLVSDDGLQHLQLPRALEVIVFDQRGIGNGLLLPAGLLREPWPLRTQRQPVLHVAPSPLDQPGAIHPAWRGPVYACHRQLGARFQRLDGQAACEGFTGKVQLLAAIAKPEAFEDMMRARAQTSGFQIGAFILRPDHDPLSGPLSDLDPSIPTVCTAKDAVKLVHNPHINPHTVWIAPLEVQLAYPFWAAIDAVFPRKLPPSSPL